MVNPLPTWNGKKVRAILHAFHPLRRVACPNDPYVLETQGNMAVVGVAVVIGLSPPRAGPARILWRPPTEQVSRVRPRNEIGWKVA